MEERPKMPVIDRNVGIYSENAVWFCSLMGGPLAAGYIIAENFRVLNMPAKRKRTWWIISFETFLLLLIAIGFDTEMGLVNFVSTIVIFLFFHIFQGKEVDEYIIAGGRFVNWGWVILIGLEGLFGSTLLFFLAEWVCDFLHTWFITGAY